MRVCVQWFRNEMKKMMIIIQTKGILSRPVFSYCNIFERSDVLFEKGIQRSEVNLRHSQIFTERKVHDAILSHYKSGQLRGFENLKSHLNNQGTITNCPKR